jgi:hypothetical protein
MKRLKTYNKERSGFFYFSKDDRKPIIAALLLFTVLLSFNSCKKFIEIPGPQDAIVHTQVFNSDQSAVSAMVGIYSEMMQTEQVFSGYTTIDAGLYADELTTGSNANLFYKDQLLSSTIDIASFWAQCYNYIYGANAVLEGVASSSAITLATKNQLTGEAKFVRAFSYFYLVNLYGDVPLVMSTDYKTSSTIGRTPALTVYQQIIADLISAQALLSSDYSYSNGEKVRPNKWAATALLARVYLYNKDWANALKQSDAIISANIYTPLPALDNAFLANNTEAIWQLMPVNPSYNTYEGLLIPPSLTTLPGYQLSNSLIQSFETGDNRLSSWVGTSVVAGKNYYFPYKYKVRTGSTPSEYYTVLRLSEQYLIRAEAAANGAGNGINAALIDLNVIRNRAGLADYGGLTDQSSVLAAIAHERQVELFVEWGHRFFDLKRTGKINSVLGVAKMNWQPNAAFWPIPITQINANNSLTQNPGY